MGIDRSKSPSSESHMPGADHEGARTYGRDGQDRPAGYQVGERTERPNSPSGWHVPREQPSADTAADYHPRVRRGTVEFGEHDGTPW